MTKNVILGELCFYGQACIKKANKNKKYVTQNQSRKSKLKWHTVLKTSHTSPQKIPGVLLGKHKTINHCVQIWENYV